MSFPHSTSYCFDDKPASYMKCRVTYSPKGPQAYELADLRLSRGQNDVAGLELRRVDDVSVSTCFGIQPRSLEWSTVAEDAVQIAGEHVNIGCLLWCLDAQYRKVGPP